LQASRLAGCTSEQLRRWHRVGLVRASFGEAPRMYGFRDLVMLRVVRQLLDGGMSAQKVRRAFDYVRNELGLGPDLAGVKLVTDGSSIFKVCRTQGDLLDALRDGQMAMFLAVDSIAEEVEGGVAEFFREREGFVDNLRSGSRQTISLVDPAESASVPGAGAEAI